MSRSATRPIPPAVLLAHGASGTAASMRPHVDGLRRRGLAADAVELPKGNAERAVPVFRARLEELGGAAVIGGHSYGGRVASLLAAATPGETDDTLAGLVLLSYPLHRPGHPDELRVEHWARITCPMLLLSGESDPFARLELLREQVARMGRQAQLVTYPGLGHGLAPVLDDALDRIAAFVRGLNDAQRGG